MQNKKEYIERLRKNSTEFKQTIAVTDWVNTQINNSIFFIHITEHTNDDLKKIIMNILEQLLILILNFQH